MVKTVNGGFIMYKPWEQMTSVEREAQGLIAFNEYGKEDALFAGYPERESRYDFERDANYYSTTPERLREAYEQGKRFAEQDKRANPAMYYLQQLLTMLEEGQSGSEEWYGHTFDEPMWIAKQAIAALEKRDTK
jgi:hypothetical protein